MKTTEMNTTMELYDEYLEILRDDLENGESVNNMIDFFHRCPDKELAEYGKAILERHWPQILENPELLVIAIMKLNISHYYGLVKTTEKLEKFMSAIEKIDISLLHGSDLDKTFPFSYLIKRVQPKGSLYDRLRKFCEICIYANMGVCRTMEEIHFYFRMAREVGHDEFIFTDLDTIVPDEEIANHYPEYRKYINDVK